MTCVHNKDFIRIQRAWEQGKNKKTAYRKNTCLLIYSILLYLAMHTLPLLYSKALCKFYVPWTDINGGFNRNIMAIIIIITNFVVLLQPYITLHYQPTKDYRSLSLACHLTTVPLPQSRIVYISIQFLFVSGYNEHLGLFNLFIIQCNSPRSLTIESK